tara:strand:- start:1 stop:222 length:222 start_codon:yes stop_codon:yes gene_type:complete
MKIFLNTSDIKNPTIEITENKPYTISGAWLKEKVSFGNIQELVQYVVEKGICPSCKVLKDGRHTGYVEDYIVE